MADTSVQVVVRLRPLNDREKRDNTLPVVTASSQRKEVTLIKGGGTKAIKHSYNFDGVFNEFTSQEEVFNETLRPIVKDVMRGLECTVFAYGQTGTGKTYTMEGSIDEPEHAGTIPRSCDAIFAALNDSGKYEGSTVTVSYLEIYNEELSDLLVNNDGKNLRICDTDKGVVCMGLSERTVKSAAEVLDILRIAQERRCVAETKMNKASSRSHCLFSLNVTSRENVNGGIVERVGKMHLVDLAGSECAKTTGAEANSARLRESQNINKSLLTLGRVITSLRDKLPRIPYRDSKLTRLLQEALGGRSKTCIIATLSPSALCADETLSTLKYAEKAHGIKNKAITAQVRMQAGSGSGDGGCDARTFAELETRMHYMQTQCEEAQAALGRKHDELQVIVERAEAAENEAKALAASNKRQQEQLQQAKTANETLITALTTDRLALEERKHIITTRTETESSLTAEASELLSCIDSINTDRESLHKEVEARAQQQQQVKNATQEFSSKSATVVATLQKEIEAFCAAQVGRHQQVSQAVDDATAKMVAGIAAIEGMSSGMLQRTQASCEGSVASTTQCGDSFAATLSAMDATNVANSAGNVAASKETTASILAEVQALKQLAAENEEFVVAWGQQSATKLADAQTQLKQMLSSHLAAMGEDAGVVNKTVATQREQLDTEMQRLATLGAALESHLASEGQHAATLVSGQEQLTKNSDAMLAKLKEQKTVIDQALEEQTGTSKILAASHAATLSSLLSSANQLSSAQSSSMTAIIGTLDDAAEEIKETAMQLEATHVKTLAASKQTFVQEVTAQIQKLAGQEANLTNTINGEGLMGDAASTEQQHLALIKLAAELVESRIAGKKDMLLQQKTHLQTLLSETVDGAAAAAYTGHQASLEGCKESVQQRTEKQNELLRAQNQSLQQLLAQHTEQTTASNEAQGAHISQTQGDLQTHSSDQLDMLATQHKAIEAAVAAQKEGEQQLVSTVMAGVQQLLSSKMTELGSMFAANMQNLTKQNETLSSKTDILQSSLGEHVAELRDDVATWTGNGAAQQQAITAITGENDSIAQTVGADFDAFNKKADALLSETEEWGKLDQHISAELVKVVAENDAIDAAATSALEAYDQSSAKLTESAKTWGKLDRDVVERLEAAVAENADTTGGLEALHKAGLGNFATLETETASWNKTNSTLEGMVSDATEQTQALLETEGKNKAQMADTLDEAIQQTQDWTASLDSNLGLTTQTAALNEEGQAQSELTRSTLSDTFAAASLQVAELEEHTQASQAQTATLAEAASVAAAGAKELQAHHEKMQAAHQQAIAALEQETVDRVVGLEAHSASAVERCQTVLAEGVEKHTTATSEQLSAREASFATTSRAQEQELSKTIASLTDSMRQHVDEQVGAHNDLVAAITQAHAEVASKAKEEAGSLRGSSEAVQKEGTAAQEGVGAHQAASASQIAEVEDIKTQFCADDVAMDEPAKDAPGVASVPFSRDLSATPADEAILAPARDQRVEEVGASVAEITTDFADFMGAEDAASDAALPSTDVASKEQQQEATPQPDAQDMKPDFDNQENETPAAAPAAPAAKRSPNKRPVLAALGNTMEEQGPAEVKKAKTATRKSSIEAPKKRTSTAEADKGSKKITSKKRASTETAPKKTVGLRRPSKIAKAPRA